MSDVFGDDHAPSEEGQASPTNDPYADLLKGIVNEEGVQKYDSVEKALLGLSASQEFIGKLKQENEQFRSELDKRLSAEAVLKELKAGKENPDESPSSSVDPEAIEQLVDKRLEAKTRESRAKDNETKVQSMFREQFGEKASEIVQRKAEELGVSKEQLRTLSQESPQAVLAMFGLASQPKANTPGRITSSVNTEALGSVGTKARTYDWYQNIRRTDPAQYTKLYPQMLKDAEKPDFYDS